MRLTLFRYRPSIINRLPLRIALTVSAIGVVYGDVGTSPLYAVSQAFFGIGRLDLSRGNILGVISLILWLLTLVVGVKYIFIILRANYQGEGGMFALRELLATVKHWSTPLLMVLLVFAASLLLSDGIITPAISVLSAVEGLKVTTTVFEPYVLPITALLLTVLFLIQRRGTAKVGSLFGPVMMVWFVAIGLVGLNQIAHTPDILAALNPLYAFRFIANVGLYRFLLAFSAIALVVTGAEALYADLGHFGIRPIRQGWFSLVYWALCLNYLGQGAYLLSGSPIIHSNVFFSMVPRLSAGGALSGFMPSWLGGLVPYLPTLSMVVLATLATIIASQALITGAFSLMSQAIALGIAPRLNIVHTNHEHKGQIYLPAINWALYFGCLILVFVFRSSENLAAAYGLAVSGVMVSTTAAMAIIARYMWRWPVVETGMVFGGFLAVDLTIFGANTFKFMHGGYVPAGIALVLFSVLVTWQWGRKFVHSAYSGYLNFAAQHSIQWLVDLKAKLRENGGRIQYRARQLVAQDRAIIFLVSKPVEQITDHVPIVIRMYVKRYGGLPNYLYILYIVQEKRPYMEESERLEIKEFGSNVYSVTAHFGFMEHPDGLAILRSLKSRGIIGKEIHRCSIEASEDQIFVGKDTLFINKVRIKIYRFFDMVTQPAYHYFNMDSKPGLSITTIPIVLSGQGWRIDLPEYALVAGEELIDPDTRQETDLRYVQADSQIDFGRLRILSILGHAAKHR